MRFNVPVLLAAAAVANAAVIPQIPKVDGVVGGATSGVTNTVKVRTPFRLAITSTDSFV